MGLHKWLGFEPNASVGLVSKVVNGWAHVEGNLLHCLVHEFGHMLRVTFGQVFFKGFSRFPGDFRGRQFMAICMVSWWRCIHGIHGMIHYGHVHGP